MLCPVCKIELVMSDRQGVEIDYCPQCRGVWLDRGELDKILERSQQQYSGPQRSQESTYTPPRPPQQQYPPREVQRRHYDDDDDYYKHKKRKNWLEELFD